ncbi:uncharacterized protein LOC110170385 [Boleophthalmus pectinirostris]|uniref:uncharacterized protein LOC110170385 n=1 Tax=Boleophthalmus pectinirostris TaxID=150288 RepID=UPI0024322F4F|nr:uncharacterized protein LOC110170385 [Boleophthalmus pectinirostris]
MFMDITELASDQIIEALEDFHFPLKNGKYPPALPPLLSLEPVEGKLNSSFYEGFESILGLQQNKDSLDELFGLVKCEEMAKVNSNLSHSKFNGNIFQFVEIDSYETPKKNLKAIVCLIKPMISSFKKSEQTNENTCNKEAIKQVEVHPQIKDTPEQLEPLSVKPKIYNAFAQPTHPLRGKNPTPDTWQERTCVGRCGEAFSRGQQCTCDLQCASHNECCQDFQAVCTIAQSCSGRCGEPFVRGRLCNCDPQCVQFNTCCPDYHLQCDARVSQQKGYVPPRVTSRGSHRPINGRRRSNSESEEKLLLAAARHSCKTGAKCVVVSPSRPVSTGVQTTLVQAHVPVQPIYPPPPRSAGKMDFHLVLSHAGVSVPRQNPAMIVPPVIRPRPNPLHDLAAALGLPLLPERGLVDDLCSDTPISGLTALSNGTIVIFKGELFWTVDPETHYISHPNSISKILGIPSHIDTVFTRSNCQGNVYVFKGNLYWRLDRNLILEPGFPKPLSHEFPGLTPGLTAALSAPATVSRAETVFFFRRGEIIQRFTFPSSNIPACSITPRGFMNTQVARQTEVLLSQEIQIKVTMKGFPVPITSALTAPIPMKANTYEHYVFSGPLFFSVSVTEDLPALVGPNHPRPVVLSVPVAVETSVTNIVTVIRDPPPPPPENSLRVWLQCPA